MADATPWAMTPAVTTPAAAIPTFIDGSNGIGNGNVRQALKERIVIPKVIGGTSNARGTGLNRIG